MYRLKQLSKTTIIAASNILHIVIVAHNHRCLLRSDHFSLLKFIRHYYFYLRILRALLKPREMKKVERNKQKR